MNLLRSSFTTFAFAAASIAAIGQNPQPKTQNPPLAQPWKSIPIPPLHAFTGRDHRG